MVTAIWKVHVTTLKCDFTFAIASVANQNINKNNMYSVLLDLKV